MKLIELKKICKNYLIGEVQTPILKNIDLTINEGEFVAIMGPSGSGKSTLMNILGFLDSPTHGTYTFDNKKVENFSEVALAEIRNKKIGFVFQSFYLLPRLTALDNVKLPLIYGQVPPKEQEKKATEALTKVGLADRLNNNPNQLSGGQQQRVAIARALSNDPKIIFADEPTGNLDSHSSDEILKIFERLNKEGKTIIMVTHSRTIAKEANRIITIKDGEIISDKKA